MTPTPRSQCGVIPPKPKSEEKVRKDKELAHDYRKIVKESSEPYCDVQNTTIEYHYDHDRYSNVCIQLLQG